MKGGPFGLSLPWSDLALGGFRNVSEKRTAQNCNICIQDTEDLSRSLSIILSLRNQIFDKR